MNTTTATTPTKADKINAAWAMRAAGKSLYEIAVTLGVTKDWLREYAGLR